MGYNKSPWSITSDFISKKEIDPSQTEVHISYERKRDKMRGLPSILSLIPNEFNEFNITRARMLDSNYHMT